MADLEKRTQQYVMLRDKIKVLTDEFKQILKPYQDALEQLENVMLAALNEQNVQSIKTNAGTFYKTIQASATIADSDQFTRFVIGSEAWDLVDWRANKSAVQALVDASGAAPPGVNYSTHIKVNVRRANGSDQ
jgi:hypothetical protein